MAVAARALASRSRARKSRRRLAVAIASGVAMAGVTGPASAQPARTEAPIAQTVLSDGTIRYSVPVSIGGGPPIPAMLDTGSFGLRVLASALTSRQYEATETERRYPYGNGVVFSGPIANASVAIGRAATGAPIGIQVIRSVECAEARPDCPASRVSVDGYGIGGDGVAGQGFQAIIGTSLRRPPSDVAADNPLPALVDSSWIVELPRPGDAGPGRLILNPTAAEAAGYTLFQLKRQEDGPGWADTRLPGCLKDGAGKPFCAPTLLDTAAPGVVAMKPGVDRRRDMGAGVAASLGFQQGPTHLSAAFMTGSEPATRIVTAPVRGDFGQRIMAGSVPFYSFSVLYDARDGTIGLKAR